MWTIQKKVAGVGEVWYNNDIWVFAWRKCQMLLLWQQATDSSVCRIALLGFAILCDNVAAMCEGDNQRDQGESGAVTQFHSLSNYIKITMLYIVKTSKQ